MQKKYNLAISGVVYGDFASLKYYLYYPVNEILDIYEIMKKQHKENNNLANYVVINFNSVFLYYKSGDFKKTREIILNGMSYFKYETEEFCEDQFRRTSQFLPDIFAKEEILSLSEDLCKNGSMQKSTLEYIKTTCETAYKENCWARYSTNEYLVKLDGNFSIYSPVYVMEYIRKEKKLPPANIVMQSVGSEFYNKKIYGSHLAYLICQFMLTKNEKLLPNILETAKKLYIHGYIVPVIYNLSPFLEFCIYLNCTPNGFKPILKLYQDTVEQLFSNFDENLTAIFKKNKIYRNGLKAIERYKKKEV